MQKKEQNHLPKKKQKKNATQSQKHAKFSQPQKKLSFCFLAFFFSARWFVSLTSQQVDSSKIQQEQKTKKHFAKIKKKSKSEKRNKAMLMSDSFAFFRFRLFSLCFRQLFFFWLLTLTHSSYCRQAPRKTKIEKKRASAQTTPKSDSTNVGKICVCIIVHKNAKTKKSTMCKKNYAHNFPNYSIQLFPEITRN